MNHATALRRSLPGLVLALAGTTAACGREVVTATNALPTPTAAAPAVSFERAPDRLADTGLWSDFAARTLTPGVMTFTPQYPLWTDGAQKRRWIHLPPGTAIDASDIDLWRFPIGTRLWKEFAFARAVETRFMTRRADGSWLYAAYVWNADGSDAVLAPEAGVRAVCATGDDTHHDVPGVVDCRLCHDAGRSQVLGFSALQLSPDRDPAAPHTSPPAADDVDLHTLAARGLLQGLDPRWAREAPRIAAADATERAALGYLHGNCSSCHNATGPLARLGLRFDQPLGQPSPTLASAVGVASQFRRGDSTLRIAAGDPAHSTVLLRLGATDALTQMPPFGRHRADRDAHALLHRWIEGLPLRARSRGRHSHPHSHCKER